MTLAEATGQAVFVTLAGTGLMTLLYCLLLGARQIRRRLSEKRGIKVD